MKVRFTILILLISVYNLFALHQNNLVIKTKHPFPDTIAGKPISFYLDNPKVAPIAKLFYYGQFKPSDDDSTTLLLSYATTKDNTLRPFYRWCLDYTIIISDGALGDYVGQPAFKYASKFPEEFFNYMDRDTSGKRYMRWVEIIAYSGLEDYKKNKAETKAELLMVMNKNCSSCNLSLKQREERFIDAIIKAAKLNQG